MAYMDQMLKEQAEEAKPSRPKFGFEAKVDAKGLALRIGSARPVWQYFRPFSAYVRLSTQ